MRIVDLYSGLKGVTRVCEERGHEVISVDIEPKFRPSIIADIQTLTLRTHADLIWASPPCTEFTKRSLPKSWKCNQGTHKEPEMNLTYAAKRIIYEVEPQYWIIENVLGAVPYYKPVLGKPQKHIGSRYLWGDFPLFDTSPQPNKWKMSPSADRPAKRAEIPRNITLALITAIEQELS